MNATDRKDFEGMKQDLRAVKDVLIDLAENHVRHIEIYSHETREMAEQTWAMADNAAKSAEEAKNSAQRSEKALSRTEKFVAAGSGFIVLAIAIMECFGG